MRGIGLFKWGTNYGPNDVKLFGPSSQSTNEGDLAGRAKMYIGWPKMEEATGSMAKKGEGKGQRIRMI